MLPMEQYIYSKQRKYGIPYKTKISNVKTQDEVALTVKCQEYQNLKSTKDIQGPKGQRSSRDQRYKGWKRTSGAKVELINIRH